MQGLSRKVSSSPPAPCIVEFFLGVMEHRSIEHDKESKHSCTPIMSSREPYNAFVLKNLIIHCSSSNINDLHTTLIRTLNSPTVALITDPWFLN